MTLIDHATLYTAEWNFAVFPAHWIREDSSCSCRRADCRNPGKHPLTRDGFRSASKDPGKVKDWWRQYPQANIAIATGKVSNIVVLDVDPRHGGFDSLAKYPLPQTMKARTGGGGEHYFFRPGEREIRNSAGKLGAGLDIRGDGGYVVAPPSNHLQGVYEWENWDEIAEMPDFFRVFSAFRSENFEKEPSTNHTKNTSQQDSNTSAFFPAGTRNNELASLAGTMRRRGFGENAIRQALLIENQERCQPPLEAAEVKEIARSIARYQFRESVESGESRESRESGKSRESRESGESLDSQNSQNSLRVWNLNEFLNRSFETKENMCFEAGRGDLVMVAARTNGGKSTLLRNCLLSLATGRQFAPFVPEQRPRRVMLLDFEADEAELQRDLLVMTRDFSLPERELLAENFRLIPKGFVGGDMFQLNRHFGFVQDIIRGHLSEVIVIDNISSAFTLNDENNNAEVTGKVVKPLFKLAQTSGAAVVFAHHIGKMSEVSRDEVYLGRGASALSCLAKTVFNLRGRVDTGETVDICCVKRKNGHNYKRSFHLDPDTRWFRPAGQAARRPNNYDLIVGWLRENAPPERPVKTSEIVAAFPKIGRTSLMLNLRDAVSTGDAQMPQRAYYSARKKNDRS
ncbi:MAG TPA: bifunctional DNA primase/polymerase [Pyrinomonadaceae bacterium]|jgi:hypothetical protein|nr:bifunctional DNA primase/polymerase [Pyrinomonadaceae bacterium]